MSLWGGMREEWSVLFWEPNLQSTGRGWAQTASMAGGDGTNDDTVHGPAARVWSLQLQVLKLSLIDGVLSRTPKSRMMQRMRAELQGLLSLRASASSANSRFTASRQDTDETHHGCQSGHKRTES